MTKVKRSLSLFPIALLLFSAACSTMSVDRARLNSVRRVAIVGFTVQQQQPPSLDFSLGGGQSHHTVGPALNASPSKESSHADEMYYELQRSLRRQLKWTVLEKKNLTGNAEYQQLYTKHMKGWQNRPPVGADTVSYIAGGIIDAWPMERMGSAERRALMQRLGVDAVAIANLDIRLENGGGLKKLVGAGEWKPRATLRWLVYDKTSDEPTWKDVSATGERLEKGSNHVLGITNEEALNQFAISAADNSYEKLIQRYHDQKSR